MGSDYKKRPPQHPVFSMAGEAGSGPKSSIAAQTDILGETQFVQMDVYETADEIVVEIDLPGVGVSDVSVKIQGGWLVVEGVKKEEPEEKDRVNFLCMERSFGPIKRLLKLPAIINAETVKGRYKNGVMVIKLQKIADRRNRPRQISIEESED